jgi:ankyrin repeat protein
MDEYWRKIRRRLQLIELGHGTRQNVLMSICDEGSDLELLELLLEFEPDINSIERQGTPLTLACFRGHSEVVRKVLEYNADVNVVDRNGCSPLSMACVSDNVDIVRTLLEAKADVIPQDPRAIPLEVACINGSINSVRLLLESKAALNRSCHMKQLPIVLSCFRGHLNIVKFLLESKANVTRNIGRLAIRNAYNRGYFEAASLIQRHIVYPLLVDLFPKVLAQMITSYVNLVGSDCQSVLGCTHDERIARQIRIAKEENKN